MIDHIDLIALSTYPLYIIAAFRFAYLAAIYIFERYIP